MEESQTGDICRVCRSEGTPDRPLFHPCICTGSIKWIHQECLVQWMRYSHKEYCELCGYRFSFMPIYSPDMPRRLPIRDVAGGLISSIMTAVKYWIHYTLVAIAWLGIVPLTACRVYRCLFNGSVDSVLTLPLDILSTENIGSDIFHGCFVVTCTLFAFIGLVWLREQILHGGGPDWLEREDGAPGWQQGGGALGGPQGQPIPPPGNNNLVEPQLNEEVVEANGGGAAVEGGGVAAGGDWNPLEWERAAEELTWERLLGLDGSLVFLEHVFWVVSLNTLFILVFAFCPYHMGQFAVSALGIKHHVTASHFQGLVTTLCGYCVIGICLVCLHSLAALFSLVRSRRILGHCYVVVKVSLLSVVEIGVLPLICGWWLDICSLGLFDATLRDRQAGFRTAPGTSMFIHWLVGMVYVYYFASFILLLREVLRPGLLWFLKNLNDPDFSPIQEMIQLPMGRHARRLVASAVIFGSAVLLMLWFPVRLLRWLAPGFLPYTVSLHPDAQLNELSLELLLLQVILPALLEQSHTRSWLKAAVRYWCVAASWLLGLRSYLLGERTEEAGVGGGAAIEAQEAGPELGAAHHAMLQRAGPVGYQPYTAPPFFALRVVALILLAAASLATASLTALTVPVLLGRRVMSFYHGPKPAPSMGAPQVHELYTAAAGAYLCWLAARSLTLAYSWRGRLTETLRSWAIVAAKCLVATTLMVGVIPLLSGLLLELVVVTPVRVPFDQTPVPWLWQDWALGVLYTKIGCAITMMGPDWFLRRGLEAAYRDGVRGMVLRRVVFDVALPVIKFLALTLAVPYVVAHSITPLFVKSATLRLIIARRIYPTVLIAAMIAFLICFQVRQFSRLYEHIKNDKYLVGRRLVNYHHNKTPPPPSSQSVQTT